ncbi:MAG: I78 family peptidase inhibitor [Roseinatronobacter sp.]
MKRHALVLPLLLLLAACQVPDGSAPIDGPVPPEDGACAAPQLQAYIGRPLAALDTLGLPEPTRLIGPNTSVTMDYRPERLNVEFRRDGVIRRIYCG